MAEGQAATNLTSSVGRGGVNRPQDVATVKTLLNKISSEQGGADGTLNEDDSSSNGEDFRRLVKAIEIFQDKNLGNLFKPDGLVERDRNTHKSLIRLSHRSLMSLDDDVGFIPQGGIFRDTDGQGYSRAGLTRPDLEDWTLRDASLPPIQMVPVGGQRVLKLGGTINNFSFFEFVVDGLVPGVVAITKVDGPSVTLEGRIPGTATLRAVGISGAGPSIRLVVRRRVAIKVNCFHLGNVQSQGGERRFQDSLKSITKLYKPQANIDFIEGKTGLITMLNGRTIDPKKPILDFGRIALETPRIAEGKDQVFSMRRMLDSCEDTSPTTLNVFVSDNIFAAGNQDVLGKGASGQSIAWFNTKRTFGIVQDFVIPAHEMGHCLGFHHITAKNSDTYLMGERVSFNAMRIPADTVVELRV